MALAATQIRRNDGPDGLRTFAAEPLKLRNKGDRAKLDAVLTNAKVHGQKPWTHFENLGEIHFALTRAAKIAGYSRLFAVTYSPTGEIEDVIESGPAAEFVQQMYSRIGGTRGLIERYFIQQKVPAESHLIQFRDRDVVDGYQFLSSRELQSEGASTGVEIERKGREGALTWRTIPWTAHHDENPFEKTIAQKDYLGRVWQPSPAWIDVPESPLGALDNLCELLTDMGHVLSATLKSRFALAGLLFLPNSIREVLQGRQSTKGGKTALQVLYEIIKKNVDIQGDSVDIAPILLMGEDDAGEKIKHITLDRQIYETDLKLRAEAIERILFGLDIVAQATNSGEDVNHFGAWQAAADELRLAVIPDVESLCWTMNRLVLYPRLKSEAKWDDAKIARTGVWFDLSAAAVRANRQADAQAMRDQGLLADLATLKAGGWSEGDLLQGAEFIRWFGKYIKDPYLGTFKLEEAKDIEWDKVGKGGTTGRPKEGSDEMPAGPGVGDPGSPDDTDTDRKDDEMPV